MEAVILKQTIAKEPAIAVLHVDKRTFSHVTSAFVDKLGLDPVLLRDSGIENWIHDRSREQLKQFQSEGEAMHRPIRLELADSEGNPAPFHAIQLLDTKLSEGCSGWLLQEVGPDNSLMSTDLMHSETDPLTERIIYMATLEVLVSGISHDMNQPLNAILLNAETVRLMLESGRVLPTFALLDDVIWGVKRINEIVQHLREYFDESLETAVEVADLNQLVRESLRFLEPKLKAHGITVQLDFCPETMQVCINQRQMKHMLSLLLARAVESIDEANPEKRELRITTRPSGSMCVLELTDTGLQLQSTNIQDLSNPLLAAATDGQGMTLKLAVANLIAKRFDGNLQLTNGEESGLCVRIQIPSAPGLSA
ncbi:hypothetical protein KQI52_06330 [bacterium]|nr:hypothetical protein [bacterium]